MVTALSSTRLIAAQLALKVLTSGDTSSDSSGSGTSDSSLLDGSSVGKNVSSLPSSAQASLASMLNSLSNSQSDETATTSSTDNSDTASTDITTTSFMALLKQNLTATAAGTSDGAKQAKAMLDALSGGTLTVSDPTQGVSIAAWDPTSKTNSSADTTATADTAKTIPTSDWNDYLKAHLQRNGDGTLSRAADNSFIDKTTGNAAYFGQVGTQFYYLSWTGANITSSTGTPATDAATA
ncbi:MULTISPECIES: hypothetical protein [Rhizobium]|uniref:Uncharacterized protein n=1 Tax=Rhizobium rhododendri TaxID=2506430 RepID=A0ABY8II97_9HYPH|nr:MULTISPECIES: hypothetical protein [Rhizobium]MBZ5759877.1 hypothetical protein [Rhizobium sp. VS19-DR96]MBZ5766265.1 hypothetical protein [Rhizobium sp. VS19-DR129.2]MBZ5773048.1 hypothetical protein [Rhizobium sp. VS19-DRK62.2]MBZ5784032.1 hypothetical protein [Rhizobium sp. VS19-DR121]MBZ5803609.1 hypothetical protein [Rhizobium sp. VS19-DR181]